MCPKKTKTETLSETAAPHTTPIDAITDNENTLETAALETAASEWATDDSEVEENDEKMNEAAVEATGSFNSKPEAAPEADDEVRETPISLMMNPYQLNDTRDISAAQNSDEELELDEVPGHEADAYEEAALEAVAAELAGDWIETPLSAATAFREEEAAGLEAKADVVTELNQLAPSAEVLEAAGLESPESEQVAQSVEPEFARALDEAEANLEDDFAEDSEEDAPLELADDAEMAETLTRLQKKMELEAAEGVKALEAAAALTAKDAKQLLADQIAEDEALEQAMADENAEEIDPELQAALPREPEEDESGNLDLTEMESCIESILFMSEKPLSAKKLQDLLGPDLALEYFEQALVNLAARYQKRFHGFELLEIANGYQFRTKMARAPLAKKLAKVQTQRLSTGAMESLAIIAYKQPALKDDIDQIRGVDSSHFIRGLLDKKLIKIAGRSELPGRPMLYATTNDFLEVFSLKSLDSLPALKELESMIPGSQSGNPEDRDPRVVKMRELVEEMNLDDSVSLLYDPKEDEAFLSEIRERVKSIEIVTPTLQAQNDEADAVKAAGKARAKAIANGTLDEQSESFAAAVTKAPVGETAEMPIE